jgi:hypothetical protein
MTNMKKIILLIAVIISTLYQSYPQSYSMQYLMLNRYVEALNNSGEYFSNFKDYSEIKGSPYLNSEFLDGKIITDDDKVVEGKFRYNIYVDEIELIYKEKILSISKPIKIKAFYIGDKKLVYTNYPDGLITKAGFMIELVQGEFTLLSKKKVEFCQQDKPQPYSTQKPDRFEKREDMFFLSFSNGSIQRIDSRKSLIKKFPELEKRLMNYADRRINFHKEVDLIKLVNYINSTKTNP